MIGTASARHHDTVRALGAPTVDYSDPELYARIAELAPEGVDAVFDHVGGDGLRKSWQLPRKGGTLVSYGTAATKDEQGNSQLLAQIKVWHLLPNHRSAHFHNFWAGVRNKTKFRRALADDLTHVFELLADGVLTAQVAAQIPLAETASALELAESRTVAGKVVIVP